MDIWKTLRDRFPAAGPRISDLKSKFELVNTFLPVIAGWKKEAASDGNLSAAGAAAAYRRRMDKDVMQEVRSMRKLIDESKANLEVSRAKATQPVFDQNDHLGAAHRREIRDFLRNSDQSQRLSLLLGKSADPLFLKAALELPPIISGIPEKQVDMVRQTYAERHSASVLEHIELRQDALEIMTTFANAFKDEVKNNAGLENSSDFDAWFDKGIEPGART